MARIVFYGTTGCHLCDQAEPMVKRVAQRLGREMAYRDIALTPGDTSDIEARIPVVEVGDRRLSWPFDASDLYRFLL